MGAIGFHGTFCMATVLLFANSIPAHPVGNTGEGVICLSVTHRFPVDAKSEDID